MAERRQILLAVSNFRISDKCRFAVDEWSLTKISPKIVKLASICGSTLISHQGSLLNSQNRKSVSRRALKLTYLIASQWGLNSNLRVTGQGLLIRNMIVKTCSTVRMRSLGVNMHLKGRLVGNSCLWIFSRVDSTKGDIQPCRPICIIRKMVDT